MLFGYSSPNRLTQGSVATQKVVSLTYPILYVTYVLCCIFHPFFCSSLDTFYWFIFSSHILGSAVNSSIESYNSFVILFSSRMSIWLKRFYFSNTFLHHITYFLVVISNFVSGDSKICWFISVEQKTIRHSTCKSNKQMKRCSKGNENLSHRMIWFQTHQTGKN